MKSIGKHSLSGDIYGGISSAIASLPGNIVYGVIAFAPLGSEYTSLGIRAGFYSSIFVGLFAAILGGTPTMISGPKATITLLFSSVIAAYVSGNHINPDNPEALLTVLTIGFLVVFLGGFLQALFGFLRLGSLIKFIPYPVIAGFLNGTAILIIMSQIWSFLGISKPGTFSGFLESIPDIQILTMVIGIVTALVMWHSSKFTKLIPGSIVGLGVGLGLYYMLQLFGLHSHLGSTIGYVPAEIPVPVFLMKFLNLIQNVDISELLSFLLPAAFSLAMLGSIDSLLTSLSIQSLTDIRSNTNRELFGQGIGNLIAACFGGIAGAGHVGRSTINFHAGGRTRVSGIFGSIVILLIATLFTPVISVIPKAVIAGIIIVAALRVFDPWWFQIMKTILKRNTATREELFWDFSIITMVMLITIFFNLVAAVAVGILVSIVMFVIKMSKSAIRRNYRGSSVHSRKQRDEKTVEVLQKNGEQIAALELEGSIFFGSADNFSLEIDKLAAEGVKYIILDMKRVNEIDSTGARIMYQLYHRLKKQDITLAISYLEREKQLWYALKDIGLFNDMDKEYLFPDTDLALEYCEDRLLTDIFMIPSLEEEKLLGFLSPFQGLPEEELKILTEFLTREYYRTGDTVFSQGDTENSLYVIVKGTADVTINLPGKQRKKRLQTLASGTFFGEMALLDGKPRSANVEVRENIICYRLTLQDFKKLTKQHPNISIIMLINISRTIANRLRLADDMIMELEM